LVGCPSTRGQHVRWPAVLQRGCFLDREQPVKYFTPAASRGVDRV